MQLLKITLKSFDNILINKAVKNIRKVCDLFNLNSVNGFSLPVSIQRYTVERSPHIDKKSREQFEKRRYKSIINLKMKNKMTSELFQYIVKNSIYPGVEVSISIHFHEFCVLNS